MNTGNFIDQFFEVGRVVKTSLSGASDLLLHIATEIAFPGGRPEVIDDVTSYGSFGIVGKAKPKETLDGRDYACEVLFVRTSAGGARPIGFRDLRWNRLFPNGLKEGETAFVGYGGQAIRLGVDGTTSIITTDDGTKDGKSVYFQVRRDGFRALGPWGALKLDATGFHVQHHTGARIDLGGIGGLPAPLDSMGAYVKVRAPIVQIEGSAITLGPTTGVAEPLAKATSLQAYLTGVEAALSALAVAVDGKTPASPGAAVGSIGAIIAGIQAAKLALQSSSTGAT